MVAREFNCYGIGNAGYDYVLNAKLEVYNNIILYRDDTNIQWHINRDYMFSYRASISSDGSGKGV